MQGTGGSRRGLAGWQPPGAIPAGPPAGYPGMAAAGGYPGMSRPGGYPGAPGGQGPGAAGNAPAGAMIELKVDPSKLPKAEELKALMYPGTLAVAVDDQSIRIVSRDRSPIS